MLARARVIGLHFFKTIKIQFSKTSIFSIGVIEVGIFIYELHSFLFQ